MESEKLQETAFQIILSSGDARTIVHEAFQEMRQGTLKQHKQNWIKQMKH